MCTLIFGFFIHVNYYRKNEGYKFEEEAVDEVVINDSSALAPHGVPTNPITRSVSRQIVEPNQESQQLNNSIQQNNLNYSNNPNEGHYQINANTNNNHYWNPDDAWN